MIAEFSFAPITIKQLKSRGHNLIVQIYRQNRTKKGMTSLWAVTVTHNLWLSMLDFPLKLWLKFLLDAHCIKLIYRGGEVGSGMVFCGIKTDTSTSSNYYM